MVLVWLLADDSRISRSDTAHTVEDSVDIAKYTHGREDSTNALILVEIQYSAKEAGQRLRSSFNQARAKGY